MKKILLFIAVCLILSAFQQEKKYTVTLTISEWSAVLNQIDSKRVSALLEQQLIPQIEKEKQDTVKKNIQPKKQ